MSDEPPSRIAHGRAGRADALDQLLAEPIVRLLMARDHVEEFFVRKIAGSIRERMARITDVMSAERTP